MHLPRWHRGQIFSILNNAFFVGVILLVVYSLACCSLGRTVWFARLRDFSSWSWFVTRTSPTKEKHITIRIVFTQGSMVLLKINTSTFVEDEIYIVSWSWLWGGNVNPTVFWSPSDLTQIFFVDNRADPLDRIKCTSARGIIKKTRRNLRWLSQILANLK